MGKERTWGHDRTKFVLEECGSSQYLTSFIPKSPMRELWFYNKADFESIAEILDSLLAGLPNPSTSGVDKAWSNFKSTFLRLITEMVPHKLVKIRKSLPWLTKAARLCMQMRDRAHREAKKFNSASLWEKFRSLRNQTINILRKEKRAFFRSLSSRQTTCKAFWKARRMLSQDRHPVPSCVTSGSVSATNPSDQADLFNLSSCFSPNPPPLFPSSSEEQLTLAPALSTLSCSPDEVASVIKRLHKDIASGPDGISSRMLKGTSQAICSPLSDIFNVSFSSGLVPLEWKSSRVIPVYKAGDPSDVANYRPKSLATIVGG